MSSGDSFHVHDRTRSAMWLASALLSVVACRGPAQSPAPAPTPLQRLAEQPLDQPPVTTDTVWTAVTAPPNIVHGRAGRRWVRNALYVAFVDSVPLARRQQLVASVQARAVGGTTLGRTPLYLLVFEHLRPASDDAALNAVIDLANRLRAHPDVRGVSTIVLTQPGH